MFVFLLLVATRKETGRIGCRSTLGVDLRIGWTFVIVELPNHLNGGLVWKADSDETCIALMRHQRARIKSSSIFFGGRCIEVVVLHVSSKY